MSKAIPLALVVLSLAAAPALAQQMKPGLWELTTKSDAFKNMPAMPPEQAEQMRKMGMDVPEFRNGAMVNKTCVTPKQASQTPGIDEMDKSCQMKNVKQTAGSYSADIVCNGPDMKGTGKVASTFSDDRFTSVVDMKGTTQGHPYQQKVETSGRWLGASCGNVKPVGQ